MKRRGGEGTSTKDEDRSHKEKQLDKETENKENKERDEDVIYVATSSYSAKNPHELSYLEGAEVELISKISKRKWKGKGDFGVGYFDPSKFKLKGTSIKILEVKPNLQLHSDFTKMEEVQRKSRRKNIYASMIVPSACVIFDDDSGENFHLTNLSKLPKRPLVVFANPKSGGNRGAELMLYFKRLLNPAQVFDITKGGPERGLQIFSVCPQIRVLACGGDGTAAWLLSSIDKMGLISKCAVAILPLGTGNDLARILGWGPGFDDDNVSWVLNQIQHARVKVMDRWKVRIVLQEGKVIERPMNNYFSVGVSAKLTFDFNDWRSKNESLFSSRLINKTAYAIDGFVDSFVHSCENLHAKIQVWVSGKEIELPNNEELVILNIPSYGGGMDLWGLQKKKKFKKPQLHDKLFEVLTAESSFHMGTIKVGFANANRLLQADNLTIKPINPIELPIQVDGEAEVCSFSEITITHLNQVNMLENPKPPSLLLRFLRRVMLGLACICLIVFLYWFVTNGFTFLN